MNWQMYELWHVTARADTTLLEKTSLIGADMMALHDCHYQPDVFFYNLIIISKGSKVPLCFRSPMLPPQQQLAKERRGAAAVFAS